MWALDDNRLPVGLAFHADKDEGGGDWSSLSIPQDDSLTTDSVLTKSETRVASGYACGMIGKEIADVTGTSYHTVVRHTQNIYEKTGIPHSTNALVAWFLSKNFGIDLDEFRRRVIAVFLLLVMAGQVAVADFDTPIARRPQGRRIEARRGRRRREEEDSDTLFIE